MNPFSFLLFYAFMFLPARAADKPGVTETTPLTLMEILQQGGVMMYPLAFFSIIIVFLSFLYFFLIRRGAVVNSRFMAIAENMILQGDYAQLSKVCKHHTSSIAKVLERTVNFLNSTPTATLHDLREVAQSEGSRQAGILSQRITYLADIGSIAPMIGLLGTVIGMIKSFMEISEGNFEGVKQMQLASGVSEALITTATGLIVGITAIIIYSLYRAKVQRYISELEAATTHLMAILSSIRNKERTERSDRFVVE